MPLAKVMLPSGCTRVPSASTFVPSASTSEICSNACRSKGVEGAAAARTAIEVRACAEAGGPRTCLLIVIPGEVARMPPAANARKILWGDRVLILVLVLVLVPSALRGQIQACPRPIRRPHFAGAQVAATLARIACEGMPQRRTR